jgi:hypothetical protein
MRHALLLPLPRKFRCHRYDTPEVRVGRLRVPPPHACTLGRASGVRLELNALHRRREVTRAGLVGNIRPGPPPALFEALGAAPPPPPPCSGCFRGHISSSSVWRYVGGLG